MCELAYSLSRQRSVVRRLLPTFIVVLAPSAWAQGSEVAARMISTYGGGSAADAVDIYYDAAMIPHIFGDTDEAALYGLGYHHMLDFPVGTLNMLWGTSGRMAEIAGKSYLDEDQLMRLWEVPEIAARHEAEMDPDLLGLIDAYVAGVEAGRSWWLKNTTPALSPRLADLLGSNLEINFDPVPNYFNPVFSPYGKPPNAAVPGRMRDVLYRMFDPSMPVTRAHVLRLGVAVNSLFLLRSNPFGRNSLRNSALQAVQGLNTRPGPDLSASNGWLISPDAVAGSGLMTLSDGHVGLNRLVIRPYLVQVSGDQFHATGVTMPGYPAVYVGFNDDVSWMVTANASETVARNRWQVTLDSNLMFSFDGNANPIALEVLSDTLSFFVPDTDPNSTVVGSVNTSRYYVPVDPSEASDLGFERYPLIREKPPLPGDDIVFQQAAFTSEGSPWEFFLMMGRAQNAGQDVDDALAAAKAIFGNGLNFLVADSQANFRYDLMARVPEQGLGVLASEYDEDALLDGSMLSKRWRGYHTTAELPRIGPDDVSASQQVWINNNVTPDLVEPLSHPVDLATFPAYVVSPTPISSWRQERAQELLDGLLGSLTPAANEAIALDQTDNWMRGMWVLFETVRDDSLASLTSRALAFMDWVEFYRHHDEEDEVDPTMDFVAHPFSQVTVYTSLLRSQYLDNLEAIGQANLTAEQIALGLDPLHPLLASPSLLGSGYGPNVGAMAQALETVSILWSRGSSSLGLQNQSLLEGLGLTLPGQPWEDARFVSAIEPPWLTGLSGTKMTRWGHVNMHVLTPHHFSPRKRNLFKKLSSAIGSNALALVKSEFYSAVDPSLLSTVGVPVFNIPYYVTQDSVARPVGGIRSALFFVQNKALFGGKSPRGFTQAVYQWSPSSFIYYQPQTSGSQTMLSVELFSGSPAKARFLLALGGTEITRPDLLSAEPGVLDYQERFAPVDAYTDGAWGDLKTDESQLGGAEWTLSFTP